jgi:hypothetical protein
MAFNFGNINANKAKDRSSFFHNCLNNYVKETIDKWFEDVVSKSKDYNSIKSYEIDNGKLYLIINGSSIDNIDISGEYIIFNINALEFLTCPYPIGGIRLDDVERFKGKNIKFKLRINNLINNPKNQWENLHDKIFMMSDDWADMLEDNIDLSIFSGVQLKGSFTPFYALKQIVKKILVPTVEISSKSGILMASPLKRMLYVDINRFKAMNIRHNNELFSEKVYISNF